MDITYGKNLITNGEANSLQGWTGQGELEKGTFKINTAQILSQAQPIKIWAQKIKVEAEYLPLTEDVQPSGGELAVQVSYGDKSYDTRFYILADA